MSADDPLFLTAEQVADLTGYAMPSKQVQWLQKSGVRHYVRADGHPRVPVAAVTDATAATPAKAPFIPNLDAVRVTN